MDIRHETFALRDNEKVTLSEARPKSGRILAVQLRSCEFPKGPVNEISAEGHRVERAAVLCAEWMQGRNEWQWTQLSPITKERIGDMLFDAGASRDVWYYLQILPNEN